MDKPCFFQDEEYPCRCYDKTETCVYGFYEECNYGKQSSALETYNKARLTKAREISNAIYRWINDAYKGDSLMDKSGVKSQITKTIKRLL